MKNWKGDEPWKRKEQRLNPKKSENRAHFEMQRRKMEKQFGNGDPLKVTIVINKSMILPKGLFKSFTVKTNIPLRKREIDKRMAAAFPELEWRET